MVISARDVCERAAQKKRTPGSGEPGILEGVRGHVGLELLPLAKLREVGVHNLKVLHGVPSFHFLIVVYHARADLSRGFLKKVQKKEY